MLCKATVGKHGVIHIYHRKKKKDKVIDGKDWVVGGNQNGVVVVPIVETAIKYYLGNLYRGVI